MLREIDKISFMEDFKKFSNGNYCHGNLKTLQFYAGKVYQMVRVRSYLTMLPLVDEVKRSSRERDRDLHTKEKIFGKNQT